MRQNEIFRAKYIWISVLYVLLLFSFSIKVSAETVYTPVEATIQVSCLQTKEGDAGTYKVVIESEDSASPIPESDMITIEDGGVGEFKIQITEPGTYKYRIYEMAGSNEKIIYDKTVYYVTVFVTHAENDGLQYSVTVTASDQTGKPDAVEFEHLIEETSQEITETDHPTNTRTGDNSNITFWIILLLLSVGIIILLVVMKKKNKKTGNE